MSAAEHAGEELYQALSRWIGTEGCHALFARSCAEARGAHPSLDALHFKARATPYIEGVQESVDEYGETATAEALESMIVGLIELLGRIIGVDMAANLIERGLGDSSRGYAYPEKRRAEA